MNNYTINFDVITKINDEQFYELCRYNPEAKLERNQKGEIIIMPPTGGYTGKWNAELITDFVNWNPQKKQVEIYRQGQEKEILDSPKNISGEDILPAFILDLSLIW